MTELEASIKNTSVTVQMDNSRDINMEDIIADVKAQYEYVATKSREEAELWYKAKVNRQEVKTLLLHGVIWADLLFCENIEQT